MDPYITGSTIRALREKRGLTQLELAERLSVSDKTVSKWETGKGYPDITLLEPIARVFRVSLPELISGRVAVNRNTAANMLRSQFYICPVCGNILQSTGEAVVTCHGITLPPMEAEAPDGEHAVHIEPVEDELYVRIGHPMTREHHITFIAAVSRDRVQLCRLYPEGEAAARFKREWVEKLCFGCNRDGLFSVKYP